ncbi:site-2 protease family protein [bacterium]|nr:site-2 protease family protein [bacterium]
MVLTIFFIIVVVFSAIIHEYAHGWVAYKLGDQTAKMAGRLTLNPIPHLDPVGSIFLPFLLIFSGSPFVLAWAKPVPYNPHNLNDPKYGDLKVAIGGPGSNLIVAIFFGFLARLLTVPVFLKVGLINGLLGGDFDFVMSQMSGSILVSVFVMSIVVCFINLLLMFFNLIPIPPLDGSKVLMTFLPPDWQIKMQKIEPYGIFIVIFFLFTGLIDLIFIPLFFLFRILVGF